MMSFGAMRLLRENCDDSRFFAGVCELVTAGLPPTSMEEREAGVWMALELYPLPSLCVSNSAAAKISAEATTRRSEEVYI